MGNNEPMATAEYTYSYLAPSTVREESGRAEVSLATSGPGSMGSASGGR